MTDAAPSGSLMRRGNRTCGQRSFAYSFFVCSRSEYWARNRSDASLGLFAWNSN